MSASAQPRLAGRQPSASPEGTRTIVAERDGKLAGFVHVVFDADPRWGSLVDNLHATRLTFGVG